MLTFQNTICAISSPSGVGAIAIIRLSGKDSFSISSALLKNTTKFLQLEAKKLFFTKLVDGNKNTIDEVLISKFIAPESFTGENMVEIYCHGSEFIQKEILNLLILNGAGVAQPGEFTKRAFLNAKMDLSQSEAVADLISSSTSESHRIAMSQMKGKVADEINTLRDKMIELIALMELELDFGEEDVEFADRNQIIDLIDKISNRIESLIASFRYGNAIKSGVPVVIVGEPNVGKSTLLNVLLKEDRAIVSSIPGTTRDTIEEELVLDGIKFKIIDTAGIRESLNEIEEIGIKRTFSKISKAQVIVLMIDANMPIAKQDSLIVSMENKLNAEQFLLVAYNKIDEINSFVVPESDKHKRIGISAEKDTNIDLLCASLVTFVKSLKIGANDVIITSARHLEALNSTSISLTRAKEAINTGLSGDFVSQDLREAMFFLGEITGQISNEEVLGAIFAKFCIGK